MAKPKAKTFEDNAPLSPNYACRHWAEEHIGGADVVYEAARKNFKILTDAQQKDVETGVRIHPTAAPNTVAYPPDNGSVFLCQGCIDAFHLAGGRKGSRTYHCWKEEYEKRTGVTLEQPNAEV